MPRRADPVTKYARSVVSGKTVAGQLVRWACLRHLRDMEAAPKSGFRLDLAKVEAAVEFFRDVLKHPRGEWAGGALVLSPWQVFIVGSMFGWVSVKTGLRRFRTLYAEVPRKNGKSTLIAGMLILAGFFEGEQGAENYCASTKREQSKITFDLACLIRKRSPLVRDTLTAFAHNLHVEESGSKLEYLGAREDTMDGLNPHCVCIDELHAHPTSKVVDVLETATGARRQPLLLEITTAGVGQESICWKHHEYVRRILDPDSDTHDETWFGYISHADEGDDWRDEATWFKANPNLGVSCKLDDLVRKCAKAQEIPSQERAFRQKHLNEWISVSEDGIDMPAWDRCGAPFDVSELKGRACYGGLDLARVNDLTSLVLLFPPQSEGERAKVLSWNWIPEDDIVERVERDRVPYDVWERDGLVEATPGNATDFDFVEAMLVDLAGIYDMREVAYDRTFAGQLVTHLTDEGLTMVPFGQGYKDMGPATDETLRMVRAGELQHGGHPVLRWAADNVVLVCGPAGTDKPDKRKSREKIDPFVALAMAVGRSMVAVPVGPSVYEERGVLTF